MIAGKQRPTLSSYIVSLLTLLVSSPCFGSIDLRNTDLPTIAPAERVIAKDSLELAKQYKKEKRYELAIDMYSKALGESISKSEKAYLYTERALTYLRLERYHEVRADADQAIREDPQYPPAFAARGLAQGHLHKYDDGITDLTKAIELGPSVGQFYAVRGGIKFQAGLLEEALRDYSQAITLGKDNVNPVVFQHRAIVLRYLDRYEEALQDFSEALKRNPSLVTSRRDRGEVYRCLQQYHLAKRDFDEILKQDPVDLEAYLRRAIVAMDQEDFHSALADFLTAKNYGMDDPYLLLNLAYTRFRLGQVSEALQDDERLLREFPDKFHAIATLQKGVILMASGRIDVALQFLAEGRRLAEQEKDIQAIEDTLEDLDRLKVERKISTDVAEQSRNDLMKTLNHLKTKTSVMRHKCHLVFEPAR